MKYFRFLKYGVALILVWIGVKLILAHWLEIPEMYSLTAICSIFLISATFSVLFPEPDEAEEPTEGDVLGKIEGGSTREEEETCRLADARGDIARDGEKQPTCDAEA